MSYFNEPNKSLPADKAREYAQFLFGDFSLESLGKRDKDKKKSNLEIFKEELKKLQEEREERQKYKSILKTSLDLENEISKVGTKTVYNEDPNTTNLYLGNLNPKMTKEQIVELFGKYGPLASVKIMWPRSEEEKSRGKNCGFVAFMSRRDGEKALNELKGQYIMGYEMKLGWGKCVPIPACPVYIPPSLKKLLEPSPPSGLPFNCQPLSNDNFQYSERSNSKLNKLLSESIVNVVIPSNRSDLILIHRTIEFVIREGPLFEALIMSKEINNSAYRFLFDNQSNLHTYYRWKLYSMMQGDTTQNWRKKCFRMFKNGPIWRPPPMNTFTQGMPENCSDDDKNTKGTLTNNQRNKFEHLLRHITPKKFQIGEAMVYALSHSEAVEEISDCLMESLSNINTKLQQKIARLYVISDILHNCTIKINNASTYRRAIEIRLFDIFKNLHETITHFQFLNNIEEFKSRVKNVLEIWKNWGIYNNIFIEKLKQLFLNNINPADFHQSNLPLNSEEAEDGIPLEDFFVNQSKDTDDSADGIPLSPERSQVPDNEKDVARVTFIPSKWETLDPEQVEAQAMTSNKWDQLESSKLNKNKEETETSKKKFDFNNATLCEERRKILREVEVKTLQYQDELESGLRRLKPQFTLSEQVNKYHQKLLHKAYKKISDDLTNKEKQSLLISEPTDLEKPILCSNENKCKSVRYSRKDSISNIKRKRKKSSGESSSSSNSSSRDRSSSASSNKSKYRLTTPSPPRISQMPQKRRKSPIEGDSNLERSTYRLDYQDQRNSKKYKATKLSPKLRKIRY